MSVVYLEGWDADAKVWRKVLVNGEGKLIIDPSDIFEDPPTDGEAGKAPTSNWAYDHAANASAHHARYTDAESVAAWGNRIITLTPGVYTDLDLTNYSMVVLYTVTGDITIKGFAGGSTGKMVFFVRYTAQNSIYIQHANSGAPVGNRVYTTNLTTMVMAPNRVGSFRFIYAGTFWWLDKYILGNVIDLFDDTPVDGQLYKGPSSNWAYDHNANADAHHTKFTTSEHDTPDRHALANLDPDVCSEAEADSKIATHTAIAAAHHTRYTDAEAIAAVGYNGTKYWSCAGIHFDPFTPATDPVSKSGGGVIVADGDGIGFVAHVSLPQGATVTSVVVLGNAAAAAETWYLRRLVLSTGSYAEMATAAINTADTSISLATIDNSLYAYYLSTTTLDTNDTIYGAIITYTI